MKSHPGGIPGHVGDLRRGVEGHVGGVYMGIENPIDVCSRETRLVGYIDNEIMKESYSDRRRSGDPQQRDSTIRTHGLRFLMASFRPVFGRRATCDACEEIITLKKYVPAYLVVQRLGQQEDSNERN